MARKVQLRIQLSVAERDQADDYIRTGKHSSRSINRVRVLLKLDEGLSTHQIKETLGVSLGSIYNVYHRYQLKGLAGVIEEKPKSGQPPKIYGKVEATLLALAASNPPEGYEHWTMQLLADKLVELKYVDSVSDETVRQHLKKAKSNPGKKSNGALEK